MSTFVQVILRSLETGSLYALASLGVIIVMRTSNITNFSQGAVAMFNTFVVTFIFHSLKFPLWLCIIFGLVSAIIVGICIDVLIIRFTKKVAPVAKQIITLGIVMTVLGVAPMIFGVDPLRLPKLIETGNISILGADLSYNGFFNIAFGIAVMLGLFYLLQKTKMGLALRATASNENAAKLMGVPTKTVTRIAWAVAGILGVFSGVMVAPMTSVSLTLMDEIQINALVAVVLGGFQTFYGPVLGAYIISIVRNILLYYVSSIWGGQILYILILLFLVVRPQGLIGKKLVKKV